MNKISNIRLMSVLILLTTISLIIFCITSYMQYNRLSNTYKDIIGSYQTIQAANQTLISLEDAALSVSTFLESRDIETLKKIPQLIIAAQINFKSLKQLTTDDKSEIEWLAKTTPLLNDKIAFLNEIIHLYATGNIPQAMLAASDKDRLRKMFLISQLILQVKQEEIRQLTEENTHLEIYKYKSQKIILATGLLTCFLFLFFLFAFNSYLKKY